MSTDTCLQCARTGVISIPPGQRLESGTVTFGPVSIAEGSTLELCERQWPHKPPGAGTRCPCRPCLARRVSELEARLEKLESERAEYFWPDGSRIPLPVEPLYDLRLVAELIPCRMETLHGRMRRHPHLFGPPLYRMDSYHRRHRMLRASEVREIRAAMIRKGKPRVKPVD